MEKSNDTKLKWIFVTGVFDLMHYGHMKMMKLAKSNADRLLVGVHSDQECEAHKRKPIMTHDERVESVKMLNYVDGIVEHVPYNLTAEYLTELRKTYQIDMVGCSEEYNKPTDLGYKGARDLGIPLVYIPRTEGISTSELLHRILTVKSLLP